MSLFAYAQSYFEQHPALHKTIRNFICRMTELISGYVDYRRQWGICYWGFPFRLMYVHRDQYINKLHSARRRVVLSARCPAIPLAQYLCSGAIAVTLDGVLAPIEERIEGQNGR